MKNKKHSPLKDKPLRYAGQSLDDQILDKRADIFQRLVMSLIYFVGTTVAWIAYQNPIPRTLIVIEIVFGAYTIVYGSISVFTIFRDFREINKLRMGRDGEKLVAEGLQDLIKQGAAVLHDIQGDKFNIDHVAISPHGIYLIETKTYSKPVKKDALITFNEENVFVDGRVVDRQPIRQAKALSKWLQELLQKSTGQKFFVQPVILFPGWYTEKMKRGQEVWILNPKALPTFIENEPVRLKETDVHLVAFHLSRYIRTFEPKGK